MAIFLLEDRKWLQSRFLHCLEKGLNDEAKSLLRKQNDFCKWTSISGVTLLHYSARCGNAGITQYLIDRGCKVDARDASGVTPLMLAVEAREPRTIEVLLRNNADIYATNNDGKNSLQMAFYALFGFHHRKQDLHLILEIFFRKLKMDFSEGSNSTQLFLLNANEEVKLVLVAYGDAELAKFTLENGYPIDFHESTRGHTALHAAVALPRLENVRMLIEHGANVDALDVYGRSPIRSYTDGLEDVDDNCEALKMLLRSSSQLSKVGQRCLTDVESLLLFGNEMTVRTVLSSDVDVDACIIGDRTLLSLLILNRKLDNLDFLAELDVKFDVNERDKDGATALMKAASRDGCLMKIEFLLEHGADVNVTTKSGISALTKCVEHLYFEPIRDVARVIEILLQHGADIRFFLDDCPRILNVFNVCAKVVVAHLAMIEQTEKAASLTDASRDRIESNPRLTSYFDLCKRQLEKMKSYEVHGTATLFKLLTEREEKIVAYARNRELLSAWSNVMANSFHLESYYLRSLQRRLSRGQEIAKLQEEAALAVEALTGLYTDAYHSIVHKIISYLDRQDLRSLCKIESAFQ